LTQLADAGKVGVVTQQKAGRLAHTVSPGEAGTRLDLLVGSWLARELDRPLSKSDVRKLIMAGAIRIDGHPVRRPGSLVDAEARLEARIDLARLRQTAVTRSPTAPADLTVLYEDDDLIAVAKPAGTIMHATADPARRDLFTAVLDLLARRSRGSAGCGNRPYLGLHHRLDVQTSGVVLFTRQERANVALAEQFARGEVTKVYHALVRRPDREAPREWRVENRLAMSGGGRRARMQQAVAGARAATHFAVLETFAAALLVEARPETGRKHQIRAHLAESKMPILGDVRYGGPSRAGDCVAPRVMLHACRLSFRHPVTGETLAINCPYPPDLEDVLTCLRRRDIY
jgi:RluA family pseudouridine synthase